MKKVMIFAIDTYLQSGCPRKAMRWLKLTKLSALDVANYVVNLCIEEHKPISNLQLQKILYYIQRYYLYSNKPLFEDDFIALAFGPAILDVYNLYCGFGGSKITFNLPSEDKIPEDIKADIDLIIRTERILEPWEINHTLLRKGSPWEVTYNNFGEYSVIPKDLIKSDYKL